MVNLDDDPPSWLAWPGHWGGSQPRVPLIDSWSPVGPAQHEQWHEPNKLLAKARGHEPEELPPAPHVQLRRWLGHLVMGFTVEAPVAGLDRSDRIVLTVNSPDNQKPPRTYTFAVDNALRGRIVSTRELDPSNGYDIRASIVDVNGKATAVTRRDLPALGPLRRLLSGLQSLIHDLRLALRRR
jgi:hypothetical protein